jgi:GR25 family glycosyltransferase involved in LPS biosynthesis
MKLKYQEVLERLFQVGITPLNTTIIRWTGLDGSKKLPFGKEIYSIDDIDKKIELIKKMNTVLKEKNIISKKIKKNFTPEQIGIYLSFIQMIEHAKHNKYSKVLMLEDDVFFHSDFIKISKEIKDKKEDVIFFGSEKIIDTKLNNRLSSTFAYSVSMNAYDKILKDSMPMRYVLDIYLAKLFDKNKITVLFYKNPPVYLANNAYFYI